ncbi:MAG: MFS transporter [Lentisphaeria bacterium]|nr:MFS transporter [Lentisphaeria bacterium]
MSTENKQPKIWKTGTLTYTTAGIIALSFWMLWGDFVWSMKDRAIGPSSTLLFKQIIDSEFLYGLIIIAFPNFTNIFLQPIIGFVSDRHRGRLGRRIPFILFTTPFIVTGLFGLGLTKFLGTWLHGLYPDISLKTAMLIFFGIAWVFLDFGTTLAGSLFNALANDVVPRELLGRFFGLFRLVSLGAGMIFNNYLIGLVESHTAWIFIGVGTLYGAGLLLLCFKVKEGKYPPPAELPPLPSGKKRNFLQTVAVSTVTYLRQSFSMPYYCWFMFATTVAVFSFMPINSFSIQYAKFLQIETATYGKFLVITYAFSLVLSYGLGVLADKFHPLRTGIAALIAYLILMITGYFLINKTTFPVIFILHGVISGCYFTFVASLSLKILPPALFAQFSSAIGIFSAVMYMITGPAVGKLIDKLGDYRYTLLIAAGFTLCGILLLFKVYRNFMKHGGDKNYKAPMPE